MRIGIDYDDTIYNTKTERLYPGARQVIQSWYDKGHKVTIFTAKHDSKWDEVKRVLDINRIPYDRIICGKPFFDFYLGNEAKQFRGWDKDYLN